jgi:antitoxin VapB
MTKQAKLFASGGSQAVRLPAEFRFSGDQVYVRRDRRTGDVILSSRPHSTWREFMAFRAELGPLEAEFVVGRDQGMERRDPFAQWRE